MPPLHSRRAAGFTLIELLIVVAIIAILAAILFPVFARARENARRARCQSNLMQIGLAVQQYTQDYDEAYPFLRSRYANPIPAEFQRFVQGSTSTSDVFWQEFLQPYTKSYQVFVCPSETKGRTINTNYYGNYGSNATVFTDPLTYTTPAQLLTLVRRLPAMVAPAETYMTMDWSWAQASSGQMSTDYWRYLPGSGDVIPWACTGASSDCDTGRHFDGINVLFADGHVKFVRSRTVYTEGTDCGALLAASPNCTNSTNPTPWNYRKPS